METAKGLERVQTFVDVGRDIAGQHDLDSARVRIVELAVESMGFGGAGIWCPTLGGHLRLDACTDPQLHDLFESICRTAPGLGQTSFDERVDLAVENFVTDQRWPEYSHRLVYDTPIRSAASFYLGLEDRALGVLVFYANAPGMYTKAQLEVGSVFASLAALALDSAVHASQSANLRVALNSNRRIGMAVGILMAAYSIDEHEALELIRVRSAELHHKLRDEAEEVIASGRLPGA